MPYWVLKLIAEDRYCPLSWRRLDPWHQGVCRVTAIHDVRDIERRRARARAPGQRAFRFR